MAAETKLHTVLPNNTIKGAFPFTPVSQVYVERTNAFGPLENHTIANDVSLTLNTFAWGATANVMIPPTYKLLNGIWLKIDYKSSWSATTANDSHKLILNNYLTSEWVGYSLIEQISYRIPGCERMIFSGSNLPYIHLDQVKEQTKRDRILELAGNYKDIMEGPAESKVTVAVNSVNETTGSLYVLLPLPNCSWDSAAPDAPKPLPLHLLGESIELLIKFNSKEAAKAAYGTYSSSKATTGALFEIQNAQVNFVYSHLGAPAEYKQVVYKYPFVAHYDSEYPCPVRVSNSSRSVTTVLTGMRAGETLSLTLRVADSAKDKYQGIQLKNLRLQFAGYNIWLSEGDIQEVYECYMNKLESKVNVNMLWDQKLTVETSAPNAEAKWYTYHIPISSILAHIKGQHDYALGADFNNAEMRITYEPARNVIGFSGSDYYLYMQSHINSMYQFNGESATLAQ